MVDLLRLRSCLVQVFKAKPSTIPGKLGHLATLLLGFGVWQWGVPYTDTIEGENTVLYFGHIKFEMLSSVPWRWTMCVQSPKERLDQIEM